MTIAHEDEDLISLLPSYTPPKSLWMGDKLPCHDATIESKPIEFILHSLNRQVWIEGLYANKKDINKIKRYINPDKNYKNNLDEKIFLEWIHYLEENIALCEMESEKVGKGLFVRPGKTLPAGTFIPSTGIIKLNPTQEELETKVHCSALQDLQSPDKKIYGIIDPHKKGGMLDLINHAPTKEELDHFKFKNNSIKTRVATSNLKSVIKFYNGYAIMGVEVENDIDGGKYGQQLLWSYAHSCEYLNYDQISSRLLLFDNQDEHNGEILNSHDYALRVITVYLDTGNLMLNPVAALTRWELMEKSPKSHLVISTDDPYSFKLSKTIQSPITHGYLQTYLKKYPLADRVIIKLPTFES